MEILHVSRLSLRCVHDALVAKCRPPAQLLSWNRYSTNVHVFEYGKTDALSEDIVRSVDLSYNTTAFPSDTTNDVKYNYRQQDKAYYVAPRRLYGLPTCRYRPANMVWVTPYPKGKINEFRENPTLLGLKILPGMAQSLKSSSSDPIPAIRSWCMLQLCDDGSLYSKLWCRNASNQLDKSTLSPFHRSSTKFHDIQDEYLEFCKEEINRSSKVADLSPMFKGTLINNL